MRIKINVDVAEAVRRGKPASPVTILTVSESELAELPQEERDLIAEYLATTDSHYSNLTDCDVRLKQKMSTNDVKGVPEPSLAGVIERLREAENALAAQAAEKAERKRRQTAETLAVLRERKTQQKVVTRYARRDNDEIVVESYPSTPSTEGQSSYDRPDWPHDSDAEIIASPEAVAWIAECESARESAEREASRLAIARLESKEQAARKNKAERLSFSWIESHGSERLRRCIAEGIECEAIYRDERLALERPGWQWYSRVDGQRASPRNPPTEAFAVLDEARKIDPKAKLVQVAGHDGVYAADAVFLGKTIVYGWPEPDDLYEDYGDF